MTRIGIAIAALVRRLIAEQAATTRTILVAPKSHIFTIS